MDAHLPALSPEDRLIEVAAVLAAGLLRLRARPQLAATAGDAAGGQPAGFARNPLELSAPARTHPPVVSARESEEGGEA